MKQEVIFINRMSLEWRGPCCQITAIIGEDRYITALINNLCWYRDNLCRHRSSGNISSSSSQQWFCWSTKLIPVLWNYLTHHQMLLVSIIRSSPFLAHTVDERTRASTIIYWHHCKFLWVYDSIFIVIEVIFSSENEFFHKDTIFLIFLYM